MKDLIKSFLWAIVFTIVIFLVGFGIVYIGNIVRDTIGDILSIGITALVLIVILTYLVHKYTY